MEKRKIVNFCNLGGFVLYMIGRFGKFPTVAIAGLVLIVIGLITTILFRKEFTKFEFWFAIVVLAILAFSSIILLLL